MLMEVIGFIAAILSTASFLPQAIRIIRTGDTAAISLTMYAMLTSGVFCWLIYGLSLRSVPMTLANGTTLVLASTILVLKARAVWRGR